MYAITSIDTLFIATSICQNFSICMLPTLWLEEWFLIYVQNNLVHAVVRLVSNVLCVFLELSRYALLGAASFLGGSMRMTVSLCVIMVEITNNLKLLPLIMLVLLISKVLFPMLVILLMVALEKYLVITPGRLLVMLLMKAYMKNKLD